MPGYNHYSDCTCGWCVNYGRTSVDRGQLLNDLRRLDARLFLERNSVRSITGCYLNPNARCPVCGKAVFFYSNQFGSRVYFDDLGPPWPKHPCTDNARQVAAGPLSDGPSPRPRGLRQELVSAARTAGLIVGNSSRPATYDWQLLVVVDVSKSENKHTVKADYLTAYTPFTTVFTYFSELQLLTIGDIFSRKGDQISLLYRDTMTPVTFSEGSTVRLDRPTSSAERSSAEKTIPVIQQPTIKIKKPRNKVSARNYDMTAAEKVHFHSKIISVAELCGRLEPIVKRYARSGTRKPRHVADRLNADGYRTANGSRWTPRLTHFLLGLIFSEPQAKNTTKTEVRSTSLSGPAVTPNGRDKTSLSQSDLVQRLSALGRVVTKGK